MADYDIRLAERLRDPAYLPSHADIAHVFGTDKKDRDALERWRTYTHQSDPEHYEILNTEFVASLGSYVIERAASLEVVPVVLEIAAGSGRLTHFLNQYFEDNSDVRILATDSGKWEERVVFSVEKLDCDASLQKYEPEIVICSWMPPGVDFTKSIRSCPSVGEYIIIGEGPGGCCGDDEWLWGITWDDESAESRFSPTYSADGFTLEFLDEIRKHQICRTDYLNEFIHSTTASFRKSIAACQ